MTAVSSDSLKVWLKHNLVVLGIGIFYIGVCIFVLFLKVDTETISTGEMFAFIGTLSSGFISFYFGVELLALQQEVREYKDQIEQGK